MKETKTVTPEMLKQWRLNNDLSKQQAAAVLGKKDYHTISRWESGDERIPESMQKLIWLMQ